MRNLEQNCEVISMNLEVLGKIWKQQIIQVPRLQKFEYFLGLNNTIERFGIDLEECCCNLQSVWSIENN